MSLSATQYITQGLARDLDATVLITTSTTNAVKTNGFLLDPDMRLVVENG